MIQVFEFFLDASNYAHRRGIPNHYIRHTNNGFGHMQWWVFEGEWEADSEIERMIMESQFVDTHPMAHEQVAFTEFDR